MFEMTPREIVAELDKHIVGQDAAKRAVAIALRNRWRWQQLADDVRKEVTPKNIIMIGPTGVGKTEITRRLANLMGAPFVKVEASRYTEVGYYGRDVESIIRDLVEAAINLVRNKKRAEVETPGGRARRRPAARPARSLLRMARGRRAEPAKRPRQRRERTQGKIPRQAPLGRARRPDGRNLASSSAARRCRSSPTWAWSRWTSTCRACSKRSCPGRARKRQLKVRRGAPRAVGPGNRRAWSTKTPFTKRPCVWPSGRAWSSSTKSTKSADPRRGGRGPDVSRQGVQRDLLPIVEGTTVQTRYGSIKTDHILFIAAGAFHKSKPSDLMPELQGRFPIRVELKDLTRDDFVRILTEPATSLTRQYELLLATDGVKLKFKKEGVEALADIAYHVNQTSQNIGARRLYTLLERLLEDVSFAAPDAAEEDDYDRRRLRPKTSWKRSRPTKT